NVVKCIRWNSLDSSSKFYEEYDRAENGQVTADRDETGEVSAEYEYLSGTNVVNSVKYPNGGKLSYGRNPYNFALTSVTQSTADGEANSTDITYTYGLPVEVKSGNTTIGYTYDYARRKTAVTVNSETQATYAYKDYAYNANQNKCTFGEQTTALNAGNGATTTILQSKTGVLDSVSGRIKTTELIKINGFEKYRKEYDESGRLISVKNSGVTLTYAYDNYDNVTSISGGGLSENYAYNEYGELTEKAYAGAVTQTYSYVYKDNAARSIEYIAFGNYKFKPLTDVYGRNTGREILNGENKIAAEYITYRKVGDHATNMPATVWFANGEKIADSIKYKYDSCGNICQITENGHVVAKYTYDSLNRLR
ncbi:MAG: RHS repeat protein, partial [Clostridia bacterium]|nr:RHS repeat protein [Clostridia bacterium]